MKSYAILALAAAAKLADAHATVFNIWVNDVDQGLGNSASGYIRSPPNNDPIKDVTSSSMTCNVNGGTAAAKTIEVSGGDTITFEWHHNDNSASDDIIASSHYGPVMTYIAPTSSNGEGDVWLKLAEDGYTGTYPNGEWAVTKLIANKGKHSITLPDLEAGEYLLRPEIIALHEANTLGGAQFYMECVQIKVTSSGAVSLPAGVAIPGTYTATDPGVKFDIYNSFSSYPIPGPSVWDGASGSGSGSTPTKAASSAAASAPAATSAPAASAPAASAPAASSPAASSPVTSAAPQAPSSSAVTPTTLVTRTRTGAATPSKTPVYYDCGGKIEVHYE